jgi:16S rRNA (cytidine1402-2'-O)-methyltransferase
VGTLFVVATPIGNLRDMTPRAVEVLGRVALIAAEDTRHTGALLRHFDIATPQLSYHAHNERSRRDRLLAALAEGDVALVTDAGTPAVSDPGNDLVAAAHAAGFPVSPVPGASALVAAVSASGLVPGPFVAVGFLPREGRDRAVALGRANAGGLPMVLFESPNRLAATLGDLAAALGDRPATVARELTKVHEEVRHGTLLALGAHYRESPTRGEIVLVVGGVSAGDAAGEPAGDEAGAAEDVERVLRSLLAGGLPVSRAAREAAALTGRPRSELYDLARRLREAGDADAPAGD